MQEIFLQRTNKKKILPVVALKTEVPEQAESPHVDKSPRADPDNS